MQNHIEPSFLILYKMSSVDKYLITYKTFLKGFYANLLLDGNRVLKTIKNTTRDQAILCSVSTKFSSAVKKTIKAYVDNLDKRIKK